MAKKVKEEVAPKIEKDIASDIKKLVDDSIGATGQWEQKTQKYHKMRMRIKKEKTFPFVGCANLRMPTIETKLRKLKSALVNVIFGIRPVVQVIPNPGTKWETAIKIEKFIDHLIMDVIKLKNNCIVAIDQTIEKGFYVIKPYWKVNIVRRIEEMDLYDISLEEGMWLFDKSRTEDEIAQVIGQRLEADMNKWVAKDNQDELLKGAREILSGKESIKLNLQDVICNYPDIALCEPEKIYVPTDTGFDPQSASWIIHEFSLPIETIKVNGLVKGWDLSAIDEMENSKNKSTPRNIDVDKDLREGITQMEKTGKVRIWEFYGSYDINNDGEDEKAIITIAPDFSKVLRKISLPFYSGKFPFIKLFYELTDDRWFSHRGIPELIEDIVKEIDIQHMQKIDQQTIRNSPMYVHRAGMINKNTVQFVFGQSFPVSGMNQLSDIIAPLNNSNQGVEFSYEREQMMLETKVEELIGQVDFSLQSMINKRQPRTLGEVNLQQQSMNNIFSLDADMARSSFEELFNWIWELWCQYGEDEYEFAYFGKQGWEQIRLGKEELQAKVKISVRGNDQNTNPQVRLQKAQAIMAGATNQIALQTGVITPFHLANAYKRFYQELDIPNWEELVATPEQVQQQMQQAAQQPPPTDIKVNSKQLSDGEIAQILMRQGIKPDIQGRALKSQAILAEKKQEKDMQDIQDIKTLADVASTIGGDDGEETQGS